MTEMVKEPIQYEMMFADPVINFIMSDEVSATVDGAMQMAPWSRLSGSRKEKIGYKLICLRCKEIGMPVPDREQAMQLPKLYREKHSTPTRGCMIDVEDEAKIA